MVTSTEPVNPILGVTGARKRWLAFLLTAAAAFVLCCIFWPLSVSGFRTSASFPVDGEGQTQEELESELSKIVLAETDDNTLEKYIKLIEESEPLKSKALDYRDFQTIRESLRIGYVEGPKSGEFKIAFEGNGGPDERQFVNLLSQKVFSQLCGTEDAVAVQSRIERFNQADWIISQVEKDLDFVRGSLTQLDAAGLVVKPNSESSFHLTSNKKVVAPSLDEMQTSIDSIDLEGLKTVIDGLREDMNRVPDSGLAKSVLGDVVKGLEPSSTVPINGVPGLDVLLLVGLFSLGVGSVVAWNIKPFEARGFENLQSVGEKLQLPIVASLDLDAEDTSSDEATSELAAKGSFANYLVRMSGLFLFGVAVVVLGFVLINTEIREAFLSNPFFGCAKIVRMFAGY